MPAQSSDETAEPDVLTVEPGLYEHFKGQRYEVVGVARHTESEEAHVVYRQLYGDGGMWLRPLADFVAHVERDGYRGPRFVRVG